MGGPCGLIINISIATRSAEHIPFMANIDRMIVHNIVIFSDTSYHTIHAFASILTKKYIKEFRPASARLRPCKRRGKTLIRRSCAVRPSPRRSVFSHRNSHEQPCAESLPFSARTRPFRGSSVRFQPDDLRNSAHARSGLRFAAHVRTYKKRLSEKALVFQPTMPMIIARTPNSISPAMTQQTMRIVRCFIRAPPYIRRSHPRTGYRRTTVPHDTR